MNGLWTEKYRPSTQDQLECPEHIKHFLEHAKTNGFPHLLLYGPPGTGKTTFALLLKPTFTLNASDERGIDVVRNKIKKVASTASKQIILLDECESMTKDSQTCLRRILEDYPNTTFIFCTNYINRIIAPLKSRLLKIKFVARTCNTLENIGKEEGMQFDQKFYNKLFEKCNKDLRRSINVMQGIKPLKNVDVDEVIGRIPEHAISSFWNSKQSNYMENVNIFVREGFSALQLVQQLNETLKGSDLQKSKFVQILGKLEEKSIKGVSDELVFLNLCVAKIEIYDK